MVVLGSDSHKHTHTIVAVDGNGVELAHKTVKAAPAGHLEGAGGAGAAQADGRRPPGRTAAGQVRSD
jgi:hypothetical protein